MSDVLPKEPHVWVTWYNRPREFDNGIVWFRIQIRLRRRWRELGGLWWSRRYPYVKVLLPQRDGPRGPAPSSISVDW